MLTFDALLTAMVPKGKWREAAALHREMIEVFKLRPDAHIWALLIRCEIFGQPCLGPPLQYMGGKNPLAVAPYAHLP
jgi:hypothetical protein